MRLLSGILPHDFPPLKINPACLLICSVDRVLIIKLSAFGDVVQAEGAIHDIRNHHPDAEIIAMTTPPYRAMMEQCPWVDSVFIDDRESRWRFRKMIALRRRLRNLGADMVYDLQQVGRTAFYHRLLLNNIPWVVGGFRKRPNTWQNLGAMDRFAVQLDQAGVKVQHTLSPDLSWLAEDVTALLSAKKVAAPYVVFIPGSSSIHTAKRWPYYNELAEWFRKKGREVVTVPGPEELELCRSLTNAKMLTEGRPYLSLSALAGVLKLAELVVGNDTGPTHLAAHLGRPGLALFSGHFQPVRTGIQHSRFVHLEKEDLRELSLERVREVAEATLLNG